jgi:hypothetical protein
MPLTRARLERWLEKAIVAASIDEVLDAPSEWFAPTFPGWVHSLRSTPRRWFSGEQSFALRKPRTSGSH